MSKVYINGRLVPAQRATISVFDRGYLYGEGLFETLRVYRGVPLFADLHLARLRDNCRRLGFRFTMSLPAWHAMLSGLITANRLRDTALRVTVSVAGSAAVLPSTGTPSLNVVAFTRPPIKRPKHVYRDGASIVLIRSVVADAPEIATIKSTNYLSKLLARRELVAAHADEGLLCTPRGHIVEGTFTNLFLVRRGALITPSLESGLLPGITRRLVLTLAALLSIPTRERPVRRNDLQQADEIFLTGTTTTVLPVREVRGITRKTVPGPVTQRIAAAYQALVDHLANSPKS